MGSKLECLEKYCKELLCWSFSAKIVNGFQSLTIFAKRSIIEGLRNNSLRHGSKVFSFKLRKVGELLKVRIQLLP